VIEDQGLSYTCAMISLNDQTIIVGSNKNIKWLLSHNSSEQYSQRPAPSRRRLGYSYHSQSRWDY